MRDLNYQKKQLGENKRDAGVRPRHYRAALANDAGPFGCGRVTVFTARLDYWLLRYRKDAMHDAVIGRQGRQGWGCACRQRVKRVEHRHGQRQGS